MNFHYVVARALVGNQHIVLLAPNIQILEVVKLNIHQADDHERNAEVLGHFFQVIKDFLGIG